MPRTQRLIPVLLALMMAMLVLISSSALAAEAAPKKPILIILTNHDKLGNTGKETGAFLSEISHPYYAFLAAGYKVTFASPKGGVAPLTGLEEAAKDPISARFLKDTEPMQALKVTLPVADLKPADYAAVFFPGGHGTMYDLPDSQVLADFTGKFYDAGGIVSAVCHGPAGLVNVKLKDGSYLVAGKEVSCFTDAEENAVGLAKAMPFLLESRLTERGAKITKASNFQKHVVISERLVTGQNPASAQAVADGVLKLIKAN